MAEESITKCELLRRAIALLKVATDAKKRGLSLGLLDDQGKLQTTIKDADEKRLQNRITLALMTLTYVSLFMFSAYGAAYAVRVPHQGDRIINA